MGKELLKIDLPIYLRIGKTKKSKKYSLNLNGYRNWHFQVSNKLKATFKKHVQSKISESNQFLGVIEIHYTVFNKDARKSDVMNWTAVVDKFFQDCLSEMGYIEDDNWQFTKKITSEYGGIDRENPRIEAVILDYQKNNN
jgi:hypothetical protein